MSRVRRLHVICYDVACGKRLRAALVLARRHACGGQKSVHECWMDVIEHTRLFADFCRILDAQKDRVFLARMDLRRMPMFRGVGQRPADNHFLMVA